MSDDVVFDISAAKRKFAPVIDSSRASRKQRHKILTNSSDGRSLRATGRTEQVNFKATARLKDLIEQHVPRGGRSLWLEDAILAKLRADGVDLGE